MKYRIQIPTKFDKSHWSGRDIWPPVEPAQAQIDIYKKWCNENAGANNWNYYGMYRRRPFEFKFRRPEDLPAFRLTFGLHHADAVV